LWVELFTTSLPSRPEGSSGSDFGGAASIRSYARDLRSIAAPVRGRSGEIIAAINVGTLTTRRLSSWLIETALPELQAAAAHVGKRDVTAACRTGSGLD
jgi:DNA-binding IclR family transcriptional regulator